MDNVITVSKGIPNHILTYWIGVLVGMGYAYDIDPKCGLYKVLREHRIDRYREVQAWREYRKEHPDDPEAEYFLKEYEKGSVQVVRI
ncbi:hypothetical protein LCGC14_2965790 [marine sediment metagenome]|uniref:Uncharacterized protein n=1 Tax=marine sediment metagenome TaxID=412755 RepID=A0A0F8XYA6_9ZZZZ